MPLVFYWIYQFKLWSELLMERIQRKNIVDASEEPTTWHPKKLFKLLINWKQNEHWSKSEPFAIDIGPEPFK